MTKLVLMATGERHIKEIAMHLMDELPKSEALTTILVVTERFTKVQDYIVAKPTSTVEDVGDSDVNNI